MTDRGRWVEKCQCGRESYAKNLAWVVRGGKEPCEATHPTASEQEPRPHVPTEAGWCGCGTPEDVDAMMLAYLTSRESPDWPKPDPKGLSEDAATLIAYIADDLGWTEHGTSVGGAWLTEDGAVALRNLRATPVLTS